MIKPHLKMFSEDRFLIQLFKPDNDYLLLLNTLYYI